MKALKIFGITTGALVLILMVSCNSSSSSSAVSNYSNLSWVTDDSIFVLDTGARYLRVVDKVSGVISAYAGNGASGFAADGTANASTPLGSYPVGMMAASDGSVIYSNSQSGCVQAFKDGTVTTVAGICGTNGNDGDDGDATAAHLSAPMGLCSDSNSNLYIADINAHVIRKVNHVTGVITTIAGNTSGGYDNSKDGGSALLAPIDPVNCSFDAVDSTYFTSAFSNVIQKVTQAGIISTVAGNGASGNTGDGGPAVDALIDSPIGISIENDHLYFSDSDNQVVRKIELATGIISTVAGTMGDQGTTGDGGAATSALLYNPDGLAVHNGEIFVSVGYTGDHRIRKIGTDGNITTVVGDGTSGNAGDGGQATDAQINFATSFNDWWD